MARVATANRQLNYPYLFNWKIENTTAWRSALANVINGVSNARIAYVGNSVVLGVGSGTSNAALSSGEIKSMSAPSQLAAKLNAKGINAHANSFCGTGATTSSSTWPSIFDATTDPRVTIGNAWTPHSSLGLGGAYLKASTNTNALSFTPTAPVDTFEIWMATATGSSFGVVQADINGGAATTFDCNIGTATVIMSKFTISGTLGTNTVNVKWNSGGTVYLLGISAYDSSKKWVDVMNIGLSGGQYQGGLNVAASGALTSLPALAPDLTIIQGWINDWRNNTSFATSKTGMQSLIDKAKEGGGSVMLATDNPSDTALASTVMQKTYIQAMYEMAIANNIPLIDHWARWGSFTAADAAGYVFQDNLSQKLHPNDTGYEEIATTMCNIVSRGSFVSNYALQFDGSQNYASLGTLGSLGSSMNSGVYMKFKINTTQATGGYLGVVNTGFTTVLNVRLNISHNGSTSSGKISVHLRGEANTSVEGGTTNATNFNDGSVHEIEITIAPTTNTITISVDGAPQAITYNAQQTPSTFANFGFTFCIGAYNARGTIGQYIASTIDSFKIGTSSSALYGDFKLNDGSGRTLVDSSGSRNHGSLLKGSGDYASWVAGL